MALLHKATLTPSKPELLAAYLRTVPALAGPDGAELSALGSYRFDDPAGNVGMESHLASWGTGPTVHMPLTYRSAPVEGDEVWQVGILEHSVLGTRWVYNACSDPIYVSELVRTIRSGGSQVEQYFDTEDGREYRDPTAVVHGSGSQGSDSAPISAIHASFKGVQTVIRADGVEVVVRHSLGDETLPPGATTGTLTGTWSGEGDPVLLAFLR